VAYAGAARGGRGTLSVFFPTRREGAPVLLFLHGGAWRAGDKADLYAVARDLADAGVIVVVPNYRLAPGSRFPAQIEDAAAALAWTQARLEQWNAESSCLFIGGHSAGAHLAALLQVAPPSLVASPPSVAGFIGVSGVYRIATQEGGASAAFVGSVFGHDTRRWHEASPVEHVPDSAKRRLAPTALVWMRSEHPLAVKESEQFAQRLQQRGQRVITRALEGSDHTGGIAAVTPALLQALDADCGLAARH
jgi:acetyl esterase/lipase